jgi:ATP-dependent Zn protease
VNMIFYLSGVVSGSGNLYISLKKSFFPFYYVFHIFWHRLKKHKKITQKNPKQTDKQNAKTKRQQHIVVQFH